MNPQAATTPIRETEAPPKLPARTTSLSPNQRAWRRFRATGWASCRSSLFAVLLLVGTFAELVSNERPLVARYEGECSCRSSATRPRRASAAISRRRPTGTTRSSASSSQSPATWRCSRSTRTPATPVNYFDKVPAPAPPEPARTGSAPTRPGRDMVARLLYGFRVSVWFGLRADRRRHVVHRHPAGRDPGLLRRPRRPRHAAR